MLNGDIDLVNVGSGNGLVPDSTKPLPEPMLTIWVNVGLGNGLVPDSTKPLPEPMLTNHQLGVVAFPCG